MCVFFLVFCFCFLFDGGDRFKNWRNNDHLMERMGCNLSYYQTNYFALIGLVLLYAVVSRPIFALFLTGSVAASWFFLLLSNQEKLPGRASRQGSGIEVKAAAGVMVLMWLISGPVLFWVMGIAGALVLAHAATRARSVKNKMYNVMEHVKEHGFGMGGGSDDDDDGDGGVMSRARAAIRSDAAPMGHSTSSSATASSRMAQLRAKYSRRPHQS